MIKNYMKLMRPAQYIKNIYIYLPLFFALKITDGILLYKTTLLFIAFSLVASSIYIFNDYHDLEEDRIHLRKKIRPLASGSVQIKMALLLIVVLFVTGSVLAAALSPRLLYPIFIYAALNIVYTLYLKYITLIDVIVIALCYVIRVFAGSLLINERLSPWLVAMTFLLSSFLALAKRRDDLLTYMEEGEKSPRMRNRYSPYSLKIGMNCMAFVIAVFIFLYPAPPEIMTKVHSNLLPFTAVFVLLGLLRYLQLSYNRSTVGSPTDILLKDHFIQCAVEGWFAMLGFVFYFQTGVVR